MTKFIKKLKETILQDGELDLNLLPTNTRPKIRVDEFDSVDFEEVDFENCGIIDLMPNEMTMYVGGDWQTPSTFTVYLNENGELDYKDLVTGVNLNKVDELLDEEVLARLDNF